MELATRNQRLANYLIDIFIFYLLINVFGKEIGYGIGYFLGSIGLGELTKHLGQYSLGFILAVIYFSQELFWGRTIGKLITRTKAVNLDGTNLNHWKVLARAMCRGIPFEPFSFLGGNNTPRGWHDTITGTQVIKVPKSVPEKIVLKEAVEEEKVNIEHLAATVKGQVKACPECKTKNPIKAAYCLECGFNFRNEEVQHLILKSRGPVILVVFILVSIFVYQHFNFNTIIKKNGGVVTTLAGSGVENSADGIGTAASFSFPVGVAIDSSGNIYVADFGNNLIRKITPDGTVTTLAGKKKVWGSTNGIGSSSSFSMPLGIAVDISKNVYVADTSPNLIRKITPDEVVTTLAGGNELGKFFTFGSTNDLGTAASFSGPTGVAVDSSGNVYVADYGNNLIRKITPIGMVSTLAGSAGVTGSTNGTGTAASFNKPESVAVDSSGIVYVADYGNNLIRKITPDGIVSTLAGTAGVTGATNGNGSAASFNAPSGVAADNSGNVYVADSGNNLIRKINPEGYVLTMAGTAGVTGSTNGTGAEALFNHPEGIAVDSSGNVYVADNRNHLIRKIQ